MNPTARRTLLVVTTALLLAPPPPVASAASPTAGEMTAARQWVQATLLADRSRKPFSFVYDGKRSSGFLNDWKANKETRELDPRRREHSFEWSDAATGLQVRCIAVEYTDFPAIEWVLQFKNTGSSDTPIIENILPLDMTMAAAEQAGPFTLYYASGSHEKGSDFEPHEGRFFSVGEHLTLHSYGGRSSDSYLPFFNLAKPEKDGVVYGIGWSGQWSASLRRGGKANIWEPGAGNMSVQAGMELTHLRLHPGEEIRTPSVLEVFWQGPDRMRGQNLLRSVLLKHFSPTVQGEPASPPIAFSPHAQWSFDDCNEQRMIEGIRTIAAAKLPVDTWWIDAG